MAQTVGSTNFVATLSTSTKHERGRTGRCAHREVELDVTSVREALREMLATKAHELFADYGVSCEAVDALYRTDRELCGILGFTGDHVCGSVVLSATPDAISSSNPIGDGPTRGWVSELTNQLVGRFKNTLLRCGVELVMSIPVVLTGTQLLPMPQAVIAPTRLAVGAGFITLWLELEVDPDLVLAEPNADMAIVAEGETLLF
jgi:chemotaxis protein CheX